MLESTSDYLAFFSIIAILACSLAMVIYLINLKVIDKNVRREIRYYQYDRDRMLEKKKGNGNKQETH
ncbi:MAG: hypothetical protein IKX74_00820 [Erysipelotrichaceae bacterium]|nr:hypothetical protein [Erysipelotrichaceae bacterium]MBR5048189.1 hypothetical protein [Erysipelotrichaceae bacterium]